MNQFIFDELIGTPTILAANRAKRTDQTGAVNSAVAKKTNEPAVCFFCKGNESTTPPTLYQDADDWNVRVFENAFPIVENHEVIVHSPYHDTDLPDLPTEQVVRYVRAILNRVNYHTSRGKEVLVINNRGGKAGASILHPHSQVFALAGFPGILELEKDEALRYYNEHNSCYWCDEIVKEVGEGKRVVLETAHFIVFVPKASRWSYETILIPKAHRSNIEYMADVEISDFAEVLKTVCKSYDILLDKPDRNFWIHTQKYAPYHWHMGFIPHTKVPGGLEFGAGIWVSDRATPEDAAKALGESARNIESIISKTPLIGG